MIDKGSSIQCKCSCGHKSACILCDFVSDVYPTMQQLKFRILFAPSSLYEHGLWTRNQRDLAISVIIKAISERKDIFELKVKLHPSSGIYEEYEKIIHEVDNSIEILKEGDIIDLLLKCDLLITFGTTAVEVYSVIVKKPILICNFYNDKFNDLVMKAGLTFECRNPETIIESIHKALIQNKEYENKRKDFISSNFYSDDGKSSERIAESIMNLVRKKNG